MYKLRMMTSIETNKPELPTLFSSLTSGWKRESFLDQKTIRVIHLTETQNNCLHVGESLCDK